MPLYYAYGWDPMQAMDLSKQIQWLGDSLIYERTIASSSFFKKRYYISIRKHHKAKHTRYTTNPLCFSKF